MDSQKEIELNHEMFVKMKTDNWKFSLYDHLVRMNSITALRKKNN